MYLIYNSRPVGGWVGGWMDPEKKQKSVDTDSNAATARGWRV